MNEYRARGGLLLEADVTSRATMERVRDLFGNEPVPLIGADPWYGEIVPDIGDTCKAVTGMEAGTLKAEDAFVNWMLNWTQLWAEMLSPGGAFYVWGCVGVPRFRPFYGYLKRVEWETGLTLANHITWKKKRAYGLSYNYSLHSRGVRLPRQRRPEEAQVLQHPTPRPETWLRRV
jgi:hypothetical protein